MGIGAKIVLARLPVPTGYGSSCGYSTWGHERPGRALDTFLEHARIAGALDTESHLPGILAHLPTNSVDFCLSNAVLEHVPKRDLALVAAELFRVLNRNGICVHRVDLKDHLGGGLNNLRFSGRPRKELSRGSRVLC